MYFASLLWQAVTDLIWAGFNGCDGRDLVLCPFQGKAAWIRIPLDKGVCGAAARLRASQRVADVNAFRGHIACDTASRSELVVPIVAADRLIGVLDLDSPHPGRFTRSEEHTSELQSLMRISSAVFCLTKKKKHKHTKTTNT